MNTGEGIRLALSQIRAQKLKSFFAVLGVIIGVMFLITVVSVIEGMNRYMTEDFARTVYGLNTLTVRRTPSVNINTTQEMWREFRRRPQLEFEDADAIRERLEIPALIAVASSRGGGRIAADDGTEVENVQLTGASAEMFRIRDLEVAHGIFDGRAGSVQPGTLQIWRYKIGHVAHREQFARLRR